MKIYSIIILLIIPHLLFAQNGNKTIVKYQSNINATLDKNIVKRLIIISNNRLVIENNYTKLEPIFNYRFGFVQPNGRPKTNLENDVFIQVENHFLPKKKADTFVSTFWGTVHYGAFLFYLNFRIFL